MNIFSKIHNFINMPNKALYFVDNTIEFKDDFNNQLNKYKMKTITKQEFLNWFLKWKEFLVKIQNHWYDYEVQKLIKLKILSKKEVIDLYNK